MANKTDFSELEKFCKSWTDVCEDFDDWLKKFLLEMAQRTIAKTKPRTPVGKPPYGTGALRASWTIGEIKVNGQNFEVDLINSMDYATFVEYGHRQWQTNNWVEGQFMLTVSLDEIQRAMPLRFEKSFKEYLKKKGAV